MIKKRLPTIRFIVFLSVLLFICTVSCISKKEPPEKTAAAALTGETERFAVVCRQLGRAIEAPVFDSGAIRTAFFNARRAYKSIEWAVEYFEPATARMLNGPPVEEAELSGQVFPAAGLQVMESMLWPVCKSNSKKNLREQVEILVRGAGKCKNHFSRIDLFDWQIFDAGKLEVFRVETLGITGFDNPITLQSTAESAIALGALKPAFAAFGQSERSDTLQQFIDNATDYLANHPGFDSFDRATFIRRYANPLSASIEKLQRFLAIRITRYNRLLNQDALTLFDTNAFNVNAFVPDMSSFSSPEKIGLGEKLFSDPVLSGPGNRSCRTCHQPDKAFTDGLKKNTVLENGQFLTRNTPTLLNAALQPALFADLRVKTLEAQSVAVVENAAEMHGSMKTSVKTLWNDSLYRKLFSNAYPVKNRQSIDTLEVMNAIGSYVRSLTRLNSRFDDYMRGQDAALSREELKGFNLFMGKAKCGTCHYMPLFGGVFPPRYVKMESEVIGTPAEKNSATIDADSGRYLVMPRNSLLHAFKTPTLRNVAGTAPYMHNGVFGSLEEVVDFYNKGGGTGTGMSLFNQTLPFDKLHLDSAEQQSVVAFMKSLSSR